MKFPTCMLPSRLTSIVDIGANPIDGAPPYAPMLRDGLCDVVGFEPQILALEELNRQKGPHETYLPYVVADGCRHTLRVCRASGMTSLFEPDAASLSLFDYLRSPCAEVTSRVAVNTVRLDDVKEVVAMDFLKMDVQGSELMVLQHGRKKLQQAVVVQLEVSFLPLYVGQPAFGTVDEEMRRQGFIPHCFAAIKRWPISPVVVGGNPMTPLNQLLEADIVYIRDIRMIEAYSQFDEDLKHLAVIAHYCYGSYDLGGRCIKTLADRGAVPKGTLEAYLNSATVTAGAGGAARAGR